MGLEIDVLDVGNADAIIVKLTDPSFKDNETVVVIDGGNPGDGWNVINHIKEYCKFAWIDHLVCTYPDKFMLEG